MGADEREFCRLDTVVLGGVVLIMCGRLHYGDGSFSGCENEERERMEEGVTPSNWRTVNGSE